MVKGITFADQIITSQDDAHCRNIFLNYAKGITKGCKVTHDTSSIHISEGYFVIYGRFVKVVGTELITVEPLEAGSIYCRLIFEIDLNKTNTTEEFNQGYFKIVKDLANYPTLTQEDLDSDGKIYQLSFARFINTPQGITEFNQETSTFEVTRAWESVSNVHNQKLAEFIAYYNNQKEETRSHIAGDLNDFERHVADQKNEVWENKLGFQSMIASYVEVLTRKIAEYEDMGFASEEDLFDLTNSIKASKIEFLDDGSILETYSVGTKKIEFLVDGSIRERVTYLSGREVCKTTTFLQNGNIQEVLS